MNKIDRLLEKEGLDGFLIKDDSSNPNLYYLTNFEAPDSFIYLRTGGKDIILVSSLEYSRAKEEADVDKVLNTSRYIKEDSRNNEDKQTSMINQFLEEQEIEKIGVPADFSLKLADKLRQKRRVNAFENPAKQQRKIKTGEEKEKLKEAQKTTEKAMKKAQEMIKKSEIRDEKLMLEEEALTSEKIKRELKKFLIDEGCTVPEETIVASGKESAKPHETGSGIIRPGEPVIIDIFPCRNHYFGDMTRTFVKGGMPERMRKMEDAVGEALRKALEKIEPGVKAAEIHGGVCDVFEGRGFETLRTGAEEKGFLHSTGHAVGLDPHEEPRIASNEDKLEPGMVLTIEPGLYDPGIGGLRTEDMVFVTEDGYENFNSMRKEVIEL
ncbi:MAG: M24 family metallopeptidase [Candidatus Nanohalobium sp.]